MLLAVRVSSYGCTWRALKKLVPLSTIRLLSCSPNFSLASITWYTSAKHEPIQYAHSIHSGFLPIGSFHAHELGFLSRHIRNTSSDY